MDNTNNNDIYDMLNEIEIPDDENKSSVNGSNIDVDENKFMDDSLMTATIEDVKSNEKNGMRWMIEFIKQNKSDIPEELRGTDTTETETGLTLAMYWVYFMKTIPVPTWMRHDPNKQDDKGWTIAIHYMVANHELPPQWMICNSNITTSNGKTPAMFYLLYRDRKYENEDIPDWMNHDINIFDIDGYSLIDYWLAFNNSNIPSSWIEQIKNKTNNDLNSWTNGKGENLQAIYKNRQNKELPENIIQNS